MIVITGPTATGKSALAVNLAKELDTEIISADSRQIYKGIPIVTAVPSEKEKDGIKHHLMEILPLDAYFSASLFSEQAEKISKEIFEKRDFVIVCGGSSMYIDALCNGIDDLPTVPEEIRDSLTRQWNERGDSWLVGQLYRLDPYYLMRVDPNNMKRIFHAVEISLTSGRPYSSFLTGKKRDLPFRVIKIALNGSRESLFERINLRVDRMVENGLFKEVESVSHLKGLNSLNTVGVKEIFQFFDGLLTFDESIGRIKKNTRVYAKKQLTWLKKESELKWFDFSSPIEKNINEIMSLI